jgi:leishmanolysin-like peptidase
VPVEGPFFAKRTCNQFWSNSGDCASLGPAPRCGSGGVNDTDAPLIPPFLFADVRVCSTCDGSCSNENSDCSLVAGGPGAMDADYVALITAKETNICDGTTVAYASSCQFDQFDRPILGTINICPSSLSDAPEDRDVLVSVLVHEMCHALGFSSHLFAYFRFPDGSPRTPRNALGRPEITAHVCPDGITRSMAVPAQSNPPQPLPPTPSPLLSRSKK